MWRFFGIGIVCVVFCTGAWPAGMEDFGNKQPLSEWNYPEYKGIVPLLSNGARVYHSWCNGGEWFYFRGGTEQLNEALEQFAAVEIPERRVVFLPGRGTAQSFHERRIGYDWLVTVQQGISAAVRDASRPLYPFMTVQVSVNINLKQVRIPEGIRVEDTWDVRERCLKDLAHPNEHECTDAMNWLASLGPAMESDVAAIAEVLSHHPNQWVRACAAGSLGRCGVNARSAYPALQKALEDPDGQVKAVARDALVKILADISTPVRKDKERQRTLKQIAKFKKRQH